jgi:toxin ParE1/3/4
LTPIILLPWAEDDILSAKEFYAGQSAKLGEEFLAEVAHTFGLLSDTPEMGRPLRRGERKLLVRRFPYSVIYRFEIKQIVVLAVAHHRQKPEFWAGRG